ncbi:MAG: hypothetical protein RLZ25_1053 [Pseudomonadota bacterium]
MDVEPNKASYEGLENLDPIDDRHLDSNSLHTSPRIYIKVLLAEFLPLISTNWRVI